jgi:hypothetical protein
MRRQITTLVAIAAALLAGIFVAALSGCGSSLTYEFDELDSSPTQDELIEFSLGKYDIPIPLVPSFEPGEGQRRNRVEFSFELHALITGDYESQLASVWERHEGTIRDRVILVCRNATLEELEEPELATLKSHLTDAVQEELGPKSIRRLLISEVVTRKL